jgi:predicted Zn-dependent peptidase
MEVRQESLGRNELVFGRYIPVEEVIKEVQNVTPERVQAFAQHAFTSAGESAVILSKKPIKASSIHVL